MDDLVTTLVEENRARLARILVARDARLQAPAGRIAAAIGMRRTGKTCLMIQAMQRLAASGVPTSSMLFVSFEDDRLMPLDPSQGAALIDAFYRRYPENHDRRCHLFLDEIQMLPEWSRLLRRLHDTRDVSLFVTGSSARMLGQEIATELRGRSLATEVWPYGLTEWLRAQGQTLPAPPHGQRSRDRALASLKTYLDQGGLPDTVGCDLATRQAMLRDQVDVVLLRDIVERHGITNLALARYLTRTMFGSVGRSVSLNKLYNDLQSQGRKVGRDTLHDYLGHFEDAFLFFAVPLHDSAPRRSETAPKKVYAADPGLVKAYRLGNEDLGQRFENLLYLDLRRQGAELAYYLTRSRREVDFLAQYPDGRSELLQVCWDASEEATRTRELDALTEAQAETGLPGRLVTPASWLEELAHRSEPPLR